MRRAWYGSVGIVALALLFPGQGAAQSTGGWWSWALGEAVGASRSDVRAATRSSDGGGGLLDVILERAEREADRRDRQRPDRERPDRRTRDRGDDRYEDDDRYDDDDYDDDDYDERYDDDYDDRYDRGRGEARGGPPFCRNGQGHPVHGRRWCRDKGFGDGDRARDRERYPRRDDRWGERGGWGDVILDGPRRTDRRQRTVDEGGLIDVLGDVVFRRLERERRRVGGTERLEGRWLRLENGGRVLQVRSGRTPVAELTDVDGDLRADVVLVPRR